MWRHSDEKNLIDSVEKTVLHTAELLDVNIIIANTVYNLLASHKSYVASLDVTFYKRYPNIRPTFELNILPQYVFMKRTPLMFGVLVVDGNITKGISIDAIGKMIGKITSIRLNSKDVMSARKGQEVCIRIDGPEKYDYPSDVNEKDRLTIYMTREEYSVNEYINSIENQT